MSQSLQLVDTNPSNDEGFDKESFSNFGWVAARLGELCFLIEPRERLGFLGRVAVPHVVSEFQDDLECVQCVNALRSADFFKSASEHLECLLRLSHVDFIAHVSSLGVEA